MRLIDHRKKAAAFLQQPFLYITLNNLNGVIKLLYCNCARAYLVNDLYQILEENSCV